MPTPITRRTAVKMAAAALTVPAVYRFSQAAPSETLLHVSVGAGGMAGSDIGSLSASKNLKLVAVADVDTNVFESKGFADLNSLTPQEKAQFVCIYMAFLSHCQNAFHQWKQGHLHDDLWTGWDTLMMNLNTPGGAAFWEERSYVFGADFREHFEKLMHRQPNPRAKAFGVVPLRSVSGEN